MRLESTQPGMAHKNKIEHWRWGHDTQFLFPPFCLGRGDLWHCRGLMGLADCQCPLQEVRFGVAQLLHILLGMHLGF